MHLPDLIGSLGVTLLLLAFLLNLFRYIPQDSLVYILLNISGAALSCYASVLIHYTPFVILEATWQITPWLSFFCLWERPNGRFVVYLFVPPDRGE